MASPITATPGRMTVEEYLALGEDPPGQRLELSEGELIVSPSPTLPHNRIRDHLNARLRMHVEPRNLGEVFSETDVRLGPATVRRPDVAFTSAARLEGVDPRSLPQPHPDLAIEIVSQNDRADDLQLKVRQYLAAGVQAVWLLYPQLGIAHRYDAHQLAPQARSAEAGDGFDEPALLPGFSLPLREVFTARFQ